MDCQLPLTLGPSIKEGLATFRAFYLCIGTVPNPARSSIVAEHGLEGTSAESPEALVTMEMHQPLHFLSGSLHLWEAWCGGGGWGAEDQAPGTQVKEEKKCLQWKGLQA